MYCVIQEVELKKSVLNGEYKELEAYLNEWIMNGQQVKFYSYRFTGGRFERTIKKAYKISVHKSYREKGRVKKKQWSICTMDYYCIATNGAGIHDFCDIESKAKAIGITEEELCDIIYKKLDQLEYKIKSEYQETEEYKTHKKHEEIINKYNIDKIEDRYIIKFNEIIIGIVNDIRNKVTKDIISAKFHNTVVEFTIDMAKRMREKTKVNKVILTGGVFQNEILLDRTIVKLIENNFEVITHAIIPCNDSGISLGQLAIANEKIN